MKLPLLALAALPLLRPAAPQETPPPAHTLADVAWLAGHWRQPGDTRTTEELWMPPAGGVMLGLNRTVQPDHPAAFEFLRLAEDERGVVYHASPGGAAPTPFRLTLAEPGRAVFENPEHDFPKRIEYRREDEVLHARIAGDAPGPAWRFERVGDVR
jgi:hypothetical protein